MGVYLRGKCWYIDFYYEGKRCTEKVGKVSKGVAEEKHDVKRSEIIRGEWKPKVVKTGHILVEGTKNGEIRKIPMNKKLTETLESGKKISKGEYVFSENGKPYGDVKTGWWTALGKAKIEGFRFHDLRHTFGSRLGMEGVDIRSIQELMGHKNIKLAMRYSYPTPEHKKRAAKTLDEGTSIFTTQANPDEDKNVVSN